VGGFEPPGVCITVPRKPWNYLRALVVERSKLDEMGSPPGSWRLPLRISAEAVHHGWRSRSKFTFKSRAIDAKATV
jgi:hypothetical protein